MANFKNITEGPKGVNALDGRLLFIAPGTSENIDVSDAELASADGTGWFEIGADDDADKPLARMNKAELLEVAATEDVEIADGATNKEIVAAIEAKRAGTSE